MIHRPSGTESFFRKEDRLEKCFFGDQRRLRKLTALTWAACNGRHETVKMLLEGGAKIDAKDKNDDWGWQHLQYKEFIFPV